MIEQVIDVTQKNSVSIRLFGRPHIEVDGVVRERLPEKAYLLLALLLLEFQGRASRLQLEALLWGANGDRAAASLRGLLAEMRRWQRANGAQLFEADRLDVSLAPGLDSDVRWVREAAPIDNARQLDEALGMCAAPLLSDITAEIGTSLSALLLQHRNVLQERFLALMLPAAERIGGEQGERLLRLLHRGAPDDESIARALLLHLHREKGPLAVEEEFGALRARLDADFGVAPSQETLSLVAHLLPRAAAAPVAGAVSPGTPGSILQGPDSGIPRVALLPPLIPLGAPPRTAALAQALIDDVVLQLCRERSFALFAPYTARQLDGANPIAAVAPLAATFVGSTRLLPAPGGGYRLTVLLTHAPSQQILFAEQFPFEESRLDEQSCEVAMVISRQLASAIATVEMGGYRTTGAASAYVHTLLGMRHLKPFDLKALRRARNHFARALNLSPNYVPAMTGLARTLTKERLALRRNEPDLVMRAAAIAERASGIDPSSAEAWREQAQAHLYLNELDASLDFIDMAADRAAHHADILAEKADILTHASRSAEAKVAIDAALRLNPLSPEWYWWIKGTAEFFLGRYGEALESLMVIKAIPGASRLTAAAAAMAGNDAVAARYRRRWLELYPDSRVADIPKFMPHADRRDVQHFMDGVRRAGFP